MSTEIRDAVKIVIEQMGKYPEEFENKFDRFGWLISTDLTLLGLNEAETKAFNAALQDMRYRKFHGMVLSSMLEDHEIPTRKLALQGNSLKPAP